MKRINDISSDYKQTLTIKLDNRNEMIITLIYKPNQMGWFLGIKYKNLNIGPEIRITNSMNLIREYKNSLGVGIRCEVVDKREPFFVTDFANGSAKLFVLDRKDIETLENEVYARI